MGNLTLANFLTEVKASHAGREDFTDERIVIALNFAQNRIATMHNWDELEDLVDDNFVITASKKDDKFLAMPALTRAIYSFRVLTDDERNLKLKYVPVRSFDKNIPEPEYFERGDPELYTVFQNKFELWRVPDATHNYLIRRSKWPTQFDISSPTTLSDLDHKDQAIIAAANSYLFHTLGKDEKAKTWFGIWSALMRELDEEDQTKPDQLIMPSFENFNSPVSEYWRDPFVKESY